MGKIRGWDKITETQWLNYRFGGNKRADETKLDIESGYSRIHKKSYYAVVRYHKLWNEPWSDAKRKELKRFRTLSQAYKFAIRYMKTHPYG